MVNSGLPPLTALSEATENLGPGTDTTSASLAHILWALAHNLSFQEELFQDLAAVSFSADMTSLENIPRLRACVKEGIRWTSAAAAMLPRIVPEGGVEFYGHFIPEGVCYVFDTLNSPHDETDVICNRLSSAPRRYGTSTTPGHFPGRRSSTHTAG